jgi:para-aminobenzoate synthetase component 1
MFIEPLPWCDPRDLFGRFANEPWVAWLDSGGSLEDPRGRFGYLCVDPVEVLTARANEQPFERLEALLARHTKTAVEGPLPFMGGAVGLLGYALAGAVEKMSFRHEDDIGLPDLAVGIYERLIGYDRLTRKAWLIAPDDGPRTQALRKRLTGKGSSTSSLPKLEWRAEMGQSAYLRAVEQMREYIRAGDVFEANLTARFLAHRPAGLHPASVYLALRAASPNPFGAYLAFGDGTALCSASPENFIRLKRDGQMETRPIKGTRPRDADPAQDARLSAELAESEKDRAENLMIVDLMRHDLGRVAEIGSVKVPELFQVEHFHSVHHLVSAVTARLKPGLNATDVLRAAFPGGSVTGAPKLRAMQIIDELEAGRRGAYCGSVVWIGFDGAMDSSIVIRSVAVGRKLLAAQAGGAILAESDPAQEYEEMRVKLAPLLVGADG